MNDKKDDLGNLLSDEYRLTKFGSFVRKTSLDEYPQLLNFLKGDLSLIGPRPLSPEYLLIYSKTQKWLHELNPWITVWLMKIAEMGYLGMLNLIMMFFILLIFVF
jgi:undecaprenyl phosphate N,N'-diacetylbacillosamine 1-phosphate transferase